MGTVEEMRLENDVLKSDLEKICSAEYIPWDKLRNKRIFITGATGLIGYTLVHALLYANRKRNLDLTVSALVRDQKHAIQRFSSVQDDPCLEWITGNVEELPAIEGSIDYVVHGASQTASKAFVEQPVETICTALRGTWNLLQMAKKKRVSGFTYLSSMEVYGHPKKGHKVTESEIGALSPLDIRNSYPISKQQCESMCCAYASEYGVPVTIVRLTQTFGPGVNYNDGRIFAEFGRCIHEKRDIILRTKGETERSYLYTADAVAAILTILLKGQPGQAYNTADESTYCSIAEMAQIVAKTNGLRVHFDLENRDKSMYLPVLYMDLDTSLLRVLGWNPIAFNKIDSGAKKMDAMYRNMMEHM